MLSLQELTQRGLHGTIAEQTHTFGYYRWYRCL